MVFLSGIHGLDRDREEVTAKQEGKKPPYQFEVLNVPVFIIVLKDMSDLFLLLFPVGDFSKRLD